ncbi:MAG TPA: EamA family transporter [Alphaproteobacteria bacterium]|nr:EamA family transporter [Alphaproteobacteria bacterium]
MTLTLPVALAVLAAAALHAGWNALLKGGRSPLLDGALLGLGGAVASLPALLLLPLPPPAAWPYLAASLVVHLAYFAGFSAAYRHGDLGQVYPIMRGGAPLLVAIASAAAVGEVLPAAGWLAVGVITAGLVTVGLRPGGLGAVPPKALAWAGVTALLIAAYTLIDGLGARAAGNGPAYAVWLMVVQGFVYGAIVAALRGRELLARGRERWGRALLGGAMSVLGYAIVLWAATRAPIAMVAALRETAVVFAALLGAVLLKEGFPGRRLVGAGLVAAGAALLRLA